ncbi:MAG: hypothetical protein GYA35_00860 [Thermoanaerobaculaceae bacterium]|nr:hypothetical protein [Thermoanaerobaculaceae bacterium]
MGLKEDLENILKESGRSRDSLKSAGRIISKFVSESLKVKQDEIAILLLTSTQSTLKFIWPSPLFDSNAALPANYQSAFASSVLKTLKGKVDNKVAESKHLKFFENVKGLETSGIPIQKMIGVPLIYEGKGIGVLEVSRKGRTAETAGPNFTADDGQKLVAIAKEFVPIVVAMIPDPFF